ncbi:MAG TPA: class I SAM-dependent methyltransferase [Burkholderiaceae bacterium]|nr:class I SAM-dependent methyltransferase [Burkholderiaceae bacterium]
MNKGPSDALFAGSIPEVYDTHMVPMLFAPYANDLARRLAARRPGRVLEIAAGTGAVTRALDEALPAQAEIVATDVNQPMLDRAARAGIRRPIRWQQADAQALPFDAGAFDAVVCQFGAMFFDDKVRAFAEMRRVLVPGGVLLFNVWDRLEVNEISDVVDSVLAELFPDDPSRFMERVPHGYHDTTVIARQLADAGFTASPRIETVALRSVAASAAAAAVAICRGTPMRNLLESRGASGLADAEVAATAALERRFGTGAIEAGMQAYVIEVEARET